MTMLRVVVCLVVGGACGIRSVVAQDLSFQRRTAGYGAIGFGGGSFKQTCTGCLGDQRSASDAVILLGHQFGRVRPEIGLHYQGNRETSSNVFAASAGVAVYVVGNFHVRAGVAYFHTSVEDSTGSYDGKGSPGILAGAGYDLYLGRAFALTPYVTFLTGTLSHLDRTPLGSPTISTSGKVRAVNFGVSASFIRGTWWCTTTAGERVKVTRGNRQRALACLQQVEDRIKANQ